MTPAARTPLAQGLLVACLLAVAVAMLHGGALQTGFKYDDPAHLRFAAAYAPWQYFTVREVMLEQSYAHVTPMLALAFDAGLALAGFDVRGHVVLLLAVLWATAVATWVLLRRWLSAPAAAAGALVFLAMPATAAVAHMLMTAHYAWGLLFTVLALIAFAHAAERDRTAASWLAALLYALACLSKELAVPLVAVVLAWPGLGWSRRVRLALPFVVVAAGYVALRWWVLGGIGGYAELTVLPPPPVTAADVLRRLHGLLHDGVGPGAWGTAAALLAAGVLAFGGWRGRRFAAPFVAAAAVALLVPVLPLLRLDLPYGLARTLLFAGWAVAVGVAWRLGGRRAGTAAMLVLAALLVPGQRWTARQAEAMQQVIAAQTTFLVTGQAGQTLAVHEGRAGGYLRSLREAVRLHDGREAPALVLDDDALIALGPERGPAALAWESGCACLQPLGRRWHERVDALQAALDRGRGLPLSVTVALRPVGRLKVFEWAVDGPAGTVDVDVRGEGRVDLPPVGARAFGLDTTFAPAEPSAVRFNVRTADGALVRTPWLTLSLVRGGRVVWSKGS